MRSWWLFPWLLPCLGGIPLLVGTASEAITRQISDSRKHNYLRALLLCSEIDPVSHQGHILHRLLPANDCVVQRY